MDADMKVFRTFYESIGGRFPERMTPTTFAKQ